MRFKIFLICLAAIIFALASVFGLKFVLAAWQEPTEAPPGGNVPGPINIGSAAQTKSGDLTIGDSNGIDLIVQGGVSAGGDLYMVNNKAIRIDGTGTTVLHIGNWGSGGTGVDVSVWGNLNIGDATFQRSLKVSGEIAVGGLPITGVAGTVNVQKLCFNTTDCRTNWPEAVSAFVDEGNIGFGPIAVLGTNDNVPLAFETNNIERMRIDTNGRVGIGTTSPTVPLTVESSEQVGIQFNGNDIGWASIYVNALQGTAKPGFGYLRGGLLKAHTYLSLDDKWIVKTGADDRLVIDASGNVGIGTTTPSYKLVVAGDSVRNYLWATSGNPELNLGDGTNHWAIYRDTTTDQLRFWRNDNRMVITSDGKVGIGTISPSYTLDVTSTESRAINAKTSGSAMAYAVYGAADYNATQTTNYGGWFEARGTGDDTSGVYGLGSAGGNARNAGGYFIAAGGRGRGVYAEAASIAATYRNYGGYFIARGRGSGENGAVGVYGEATEATNGGIPITNYGGYFTAAGSGAGTAGVFGEAVNAGATGSTYGGYFKTNGAITGAAGVYASASSLAAADGVYGVYGAAESSGSYRNYGGYFQAYGAHDDTSGVYGLINTLGAGVRGYAGSSGDYQNYGGWFKSESVRGRGVFGAAGSTTGENYGGYFIAEGSGAGTAGVYGEAGNAGATGSTYGGRFITNGTAAGTAGVYGYAYGAGQVAGVRGFADNASGVTNYGGVFSTNGTGYGSAGVLGYATGAGTVYGVYGYAYNNGAVENYGGYFRAYGTGGARGVYGYASGATGTNFGVYGQVDSSSGWAGYFTGGYGLYADKVVAGNAVNPNGYALFVTGDSYLTGNLNVGDGTIVVRRCTGFSNTGLLVVSTNADARCGFGSHVDTGLRVK